MAEVSIENHAKYILVRLSEKFQSSDLVKIPRDVTPCRESGLRRVLVDMTGAEFKLDGLDRYLMGYDLAERWPRIFELGIVLTHEQTRGGSESGPRPVELVLSNRGIRNRFFFDIADGLAWAAA